jgi:predicted nucleic acid-binding protein
MNRPPTYLLDTNILLHWTRGSSVGEVVEGQFGLRASPFRPLICVVTLGEIEAFSRNAKWSQRRRDSLQDLRRKLVTVDISDPRIISAYADLSTLAKNNGWPIFHDHNDLWIAAATRVTGATLLSTDAKGFLPLREGNHLPVIVLDAMTGWPVP